MPSVASHHLLYIPAQWFEYDLIDKISSVLQKNLQLSVQSSHAQHGERFVRLHYAMSGQTENNIDLNTLTQLIHAQVSSWSNDFQEAARHVYGELNNCHMQNYANCFTKSYQERFSVLEALRDIESAQEAIKTQQIQLRIYQRATDACAKFRIKLYNWGHKIPLSEIIPVLENMGLRILGESSYNLDLQNSDNLVWLHDFSLEILDKECVALNQISTQLQDVFVNIWNNNIENDVLNSLVLYASLT